MTTMHLSPTRSTSSRQTKSDSPCTLESADDNHARLANWGQNGMRYTKKVQG